MVDQPVRSRAQVSDLLLSPRTARASSGALIAVVEDAHELAVASSLNRPELHRERIAALRQIGTDITTLAEACAVLLRRAG